MVSKFVMPNCRVPSFVQFLVVALSLGLTTPPVLSQTSYFPARTFDKNPRYDEFVRKWYSDALQRSEEPSLFEKANHRSAESYRFLWLRSFNDGIVIRLDVHADGTATLTEKIVGSRGSAKPGKLVHQETKEIPASQARTFRDHVKDGNFWSLATKTKQAGCDGSEWIVEGVRSGKYHVVDRWSPERGLIHDLGMELAINLAGLKLSGRDIY